MASAIFVQGPKDAIGFETLTVDSTAGGVGLTKSKYRLFNTTTLERMSASMAVLTLETASIRWMLDPGTTVSTTVGHLMNAGDSIEIVGFSNLMNFKAIRTGGTSGTFQVTYYSS